MGMARTVGPRWDALNAEHLDLVKAAVDGHDGMVVRTEGDAVFASFPEAGTAVAAAVEAQRAMAAHPWPDGRHGPDPDRPPHGRGPSRRR